MAGHRFHNRVCMKGLNRMPRRARACGVVAALFLLCASSLIAASAPPTGRKPLYPPGVLARRDRAPSPTMRTQPA